MNYSTKNYNYMCFSTSFYREIEGKEINFMLTVDNVGRVHLRPTGFEDELEYTFVDGELQIKIKEKI